MFHQQSKSIWFILCFFVSINGLIANEYSTPFNINSVTTESNNFMEFSTDSIQEYRNLAIEFAKKSQAKESTEYIIKYISATSDISFIDDHLFRAIINSNEYRALKEKYCPKISALGFFYFCAGLLGLFVFVILNLKKNRDKTGSFLISLFVLFHSVFILHTALYVMKLQYYLPHTLFVSTTFSFLYGPLLYFYFKRTIYNYKFKWLDLLHFIPSMVLLIYIFPYYLLSRLEKFNVVFNQENTLLPGSYMIIVVKIISLSLYAYLLFRIYKENRLNLSASKYKKNYLWQRNAIALYTIYTVSYIIYALVLVKIIDVPMLYHLQRLVMASVVFYVAYISYVQPEIFMGKIKLLDPTSLFKYKKSGLTLSYSLELTDNLLKLLNEDKIYKENNLNLEALSEKLETTRHNTSQIINEQFEMNFSELMNKYRICEAVEILKNDEFNNLKIIQVAYEVGFNNKASFNKCFKRHQSQTPSQYLESLQQ